MVTVHGSYVQFRFFRPGARSVYLAGDFNGWKNDQLAMVPTGNGYWLAVLRLPEGSHCFRYYADGQWYTDFAAFGVEHGPYGANSVVRIGPCQAARERAPSRTVDAPKLPALAGAGRGPRERAA